MGQTLYELQHEYIVAAQSLQDMDLDPQTIADTLESMSGDLEAKAANTIAVAKNMRAMSESIKQAEASMAARRKALDARAEMLESRILAMMLETGISKIDSPYFSISIKQNPPSVDVFDEAQLPVEYMRHIPESYAPDKALIKKALGDAHDVPGARLINKQRLDIK